MPLKWGEGPGQEVGEQSQRWGTPSYLLTGHTSLYTLRMELLTVPFELRLCPQSSRAPGPLMDISQSLLSAHGALGFQPPHSPARGPRD